MRRNRDPSRAGSARAQRKYHRRGARTRADGRADKARPHFNDALGDGSLGGISTHEEDDIRTAIAKLIIGKPIFSEEWINTEAMASIFYPEADTNEVHEHAASERMNIIKNLFHKE